MKRCLPQEKSNNLSTVADSFANQPFSLRVSPRVPVVFGVDRLLLLTLRTYTYNNVQLLWFTPFAGVKSANYLHLPGAHQG